MEIRIKVKKAAIEIAAFWGSVCPVIHSGENEVIRSKMFRNNIRKYL